MKRRKGKEMVKEQKDIMKGRRGGRMKVKGRKRNMK